MSDEKFLTYTVNDSIAVVRMNDAESRNALNPERFEMLTWALVRAEVDDAVDIVVVTGSGGVFSSGGDLKDLLRAHNSSTAPLNAYQYIHSFSGMYRQVEMMKKTVVAAVQGLAHAGGLCLVLASDMSIASSSATFRLPEALRGFGDLYAAVRLPQRIGWARAKSMALTCRTVDAEEALEIGLINEVVADDEFDAGLGRMLQALQRSSSQSRTLYKDGMNRSLDEYDARLHFSSITSSDSQEGLEAFADKRAPRWSAT